MRNRLELEERFQEMSPRQKQAFMDKIKLVSQTTTDFSVQHIPEILKGNHSPKKLPRLYQSDIERLLKDSNPKDSVTIVTSSKLPPILSQFLTTKELGLFATLNTKSKRRFQEETKRIISSISTKKLKHLTEFLSILPTLPFLQELVLERKKFSNGDITLLENALPRLTHLKKLVLRGNHLSSDSLLGSISHLKNLVELDIGSNSFHTQNSPTLTKVFISLKKLKVLKIDGNTWGEGTDLSSIPSSVTELNLANTKISLDSIPNLPKLTSLNLSQNGINQEVWERNLEKFGTNLEYLNLNGNRLTSLERVYDLKHLKTILVSENRITDLPNVLPPSITELDISENRLTEQSPIIIPVELKRLNVSGNRLGESFFYQLPGMKNLEEIRLNRSDLRDQKCLLLLQSTFSLSRLEELHIEKNHITDEIVGWIIKWLQLKPRVEFLGLRGNKITQKGCRELERLFPSKVDC